MIVITKERRVQRGEGASEREPTPTEQGNAKTRLAASRQTTLTAAPLAAPKVRRC